MGLRDRLKKMKTRSGSSSPAGTATPTTTTTAKVEYYKPGEEPKLKYRGKISKEHTDKLHAFSFSDAWTRRRSHVSGTMSPGGTVAQSRAASVVGSLHAGRKRSVASHSGSDTDGGSRRRSVVVVGGGGGGDPVPATVPESEVDDTDVLNAGGLSRPPTSGGGGGRPLEPAHASPFSPDELHRALSRATVESPAGGARRGEIAAH